MKAYNSSWSLLTRLRQRTSLQVQPEQFNDILSQNQKEKLGWGGSSGIELYAAIWSIPETKRGKKNLPQVPRYSDKFRRNRITVRLKHILSHNSVSST